MQTINQTHKIHAAPDDVYRALTNPFAIELWSGFPAVMSTEPGSEFSILEGDIVGENIEFEENKCIKQQWYFGEQDEASIVTIQLSPLGEGKTKVQLEHTNVPEEAYEEMVEGWKDMYWGKVKTFFK